MFDFDPGAGIEWPFVVETALRMRELLKAGGLDSWPKLTGGKGVHIMAPAASSGLTHGAAHDVSRALATQLAIRDRKRYTLTAALESRSGRLFIDYLTNGRGTTAVGTYSPRARAGFPIAAPVSWDDLERGIRPDTFTMDQPFPEKRAPRRRKAPRR